MAQISTNTRKDLFIHIAIICTLIAIFFLGFFFIYLPFSTNHGQSVTVPDVRKMNIETLEDYLDERSLDYVVNDCTFVANTPPLTVISQYPLPGSKVKEGRKIYVTIVSRSAPIIKMPKLTDMTRKSAEMLMKSVGLELGNFTYVADVAQNSVLKQLYNGREIAPGENVAKGSRIDLWIGNGLGEVLFSAPSVIGLSPDEAEIQIIGADLKVGQKIFVKAEPGQLPGTIVKQNPTEGTQVRMGQIIDIWITEGGEEEENP